MSFLTKINRLLKFYELKSKLSTKWFRWDSNPRLRRDSNLSRAPQTARPLNLIVISFWKFEFTMCPTISLKDAWQTKNKKKVLPGFEPGLLDSKSRVITITLQDRNTKGITPGGTRTHNLTLRRGAPYPLGHRGQSTLKCSWRGSNPRPSAHKTNALPLSYRSKYICESFRFTYEQPPQLSWQSGGL